MKNLLLTFFVVAVASLTVVGCGSNSDAFTLYRDSPLDPNMRIHISTFDSTDGETYNRDNCELAAKLFQSQQGVKSKFWCEKGGFKK